MRPRLPRPSRRAVLGAVAVVTPLAPFAARAQGRPVQPWERRSTAFFSVGADAVFSSVRARASDPRIGDGYGFDVHGTLGLSALALGVGYQRTQHDLTGATGRATYSTVYAEPRLLLDLGAGNFTPYVAGRVGRTRVSSPPLGSTLTTDLTGTSYGAGGGVQVWLARAVAVDLGAMWSRLDFGNRTSARDVIRNAEDGLLLRAGVRLTP